MKAKTEFFKLKVNYATNSLKHYTSWCSSLHASSLEEQKVVRVKIVKPIRNEKSDWVTLTMKNNRKQFTEITIDKKFLHEMEAKYGHEKFKELLVETTIDCWNKTQKNATNEIDITTLKDIISSKVRELK